MNVATIADILALAATQTLRCKGCGEPLTPDHPDARWDGWHPHGTCQRYYGAGQRVDFDDWANLTGTSEPLFRVWAEGEPMVGIPSWFPTGGNAPRRRYEPVHPTTCQCGGCWHVPAAILTN